MTNNKTETYISLTILLVLTGIGGAIFWAQFQYYMPVLVSSSLESDISAHPADAEKPSVKSLVLLPENIVPLMQPEVFSPENLSDKINGKAELYLSAGVLGLQCQRFTENGSPDLWVEFFVYDMGNNTNAFSVFSSQHREDAEPMPLAKFSYRTENAVFLVHGNYYVEVISAAASEKSFALMQSLVKSFMQEHPAETKAISETELFPKTGLKENSITLRSADVFGYEKLNHVFTATYIIADSEATAFLSRRETREEAETLASGFHAFLLSFGGKEIEQASQIKNAKIVEIMGTYDTVFSSGNFLGGVHEAESREIAEKLGDMLYHCLNSD